MRVDCHCLTPAPARHWRARALLAVLVVAGALLLLPPTARALPTAAPWQQAEHPAAESGQSREGSEGHAEEGLLPLIAKVFNFAVLAGVLAYFLKTPIQAYLASRATQIRQDLVAAADMRAAAEAQLAEIDSRLRSLPAELAALRTQGEEDVRAERARIEQAAVEERRRLLEQTRREIEMRLRIARRQLVELAAELSVDVARTRIARTITPEDQLRLVDRYATQLREAR